MSNRAVDCSFPKTKRLLNAKDYGQVFDDAQAKASHQHLLLLAKVNDRSGHRLGLVIAKKNVRLAVQRNRIKRVAREFFRSQSGVGTHMDVVLLTRRGIDQLDNNQLSTILQQQWQKLLRNLSKPEMNPRQDR